MKNCVYLCRRLFKELIQPFISDEIKETLFIYTFDYGLYISNGAAERQDIRPCH